MKPRIHPAVGNHEYLTNNAAGYFDYFGSAAGTRGEGWYSYDLGAWHVVVLNSNCGYVGCGPGSPQLDWLSADLAKADAHCLLAYWHHPRWSSGRHGSSTAVQPFWDALERAGVDVILNGHDHTYERVLADGLEQFVVGTGGRSLYPLTKRPLPTTQVRTDKAYGALWMELFADGYRWQFVPLGTSGFQDAGSGTCG
jgi:alkaline phosphatase